MTVGNYIVLNQLIAGSIMVRHMILILVVSLPLRVYYLMRCTHYALWRDIMNSFDSTLSYRNIRSISNTQYKQFSHNLTLRRMSLVSLMDIPMLVSALNSTIVFLF